MTVNNTSFLVIIRHGWDSAHAANLFRDTTNSQLDQMRELNKSWEMAFNILHNSQCENTAIRDIAENFIQALRYYREALKYTEHSESRKQCFDEGDAIYAAANASVLDHCADNDEFDNALAAIPASEGILT